MTNWQVRRGVLADAPALARINVAAWRGAYAGIVPADYLAAMDVADRIEKWQAYLVHPAPSATFVAVDEHGAIGAYCNVGALRTEDGTGEPGAGELRSIYADPAHQGSGAGRIVHDAALEYLAELGYERAGLWVFEGNKRTRAWYEARGWAPDGQTHLDEIAGRVIPELRYSRRLTNG